MRGAKSIWVLVLLLSVLAGCGGGRDVEVNVYVGDRATQTAMAQLPAMPGPTSASAEPGQVEAQPTATPPEPAPAAPTEPQQQAVPPTAASPTEASTEAPPPPPTQPPQIPEDLYTFDPAAWEASVTTLSTFRQKVSLDFTTDETGANGKAYYEGEVTTNPTALHATLRVEGQAASQLPSNQAEVIWIGEEAWVKIGRRPWMPVPVTALDSEYAGQVVGIGDLLPYIPQAHRAMPDETVNGIPCKHYLYDSKDLQVESGMTDAQGDIWVAKDGGYVVRLTMNGHGTYYDTYSASGTLNLVYDLYDVNAPISISPPR
jgi:hypothetical protein